MTKAKLQYDSIELNPVRISKMTAVTIYYRHMKYVNPFIFALITYSIGSDEVLRKGQTLREALLIVQILYSQTMSYQMMVMCLTWKVMLIHSYNPRRDILQIQTKSHGQ